MSAPEDPDVRNIAEGGDGAWHATIRHPQHGDLAFTGQLPTALALARHMVVMDNVMADLSPGVQPRFTTQLLCAAIAALTPPDPVNAPGKGLLVQLPVLDEVREEDDETGHVTIRRTFYDPTTELHHGFLCEVWTDFSAWRAGLLTPEKVEELGKGSGQTRGSASSGESGESGPARPTTPA